MRFAASGKTPEEEAGRHELRICPARTRLPARALDLASERNQASGRVNRRFDCSWRDKALAEALREITPSLQQREATAMARKPNYKFERMERDKAKAAKVAEKAKAKSEAKEKAALEKAELDKEPTP
jgi:hypothetical protein